jgi:hypothetical protein
MSIGAMLPSLRAQAPSTAAAGERTVWYFYRVTWGHQDEFVELFKKNHYPVLKEQMGDRLVRFKAYVPQFHGDGRADWTFATEIVFKNDAIFMGPSPEQAIVKRLFPDAAKFRGRSAALRIVDAHWDISAPRSPHGVARASRPDLADRGDLDTHDLLRRGARRAEASDLILHAGDICGPEVLEVLERIAPVFAVRGNNDRGSWARALPIPHPGRFGLSHPHRPRLEGARRRPGARVSRGRDQASHSPRFKGEAVFSS